MKTTTPDVAVVQTWTAEQFKQWGEGFRRRFADLLKTQKGGDAGGHRHGSPEWFEHVKRKLREAGVVEPADEHVRVFQLGVATHDKTWRTRAENVGASLFAVAGLEPLRADERPDERADEPPDERTTEAVQPTLTAESMVQQQTVPLASPTGGES